MKLNSRATSIYTSDADAAAKLEELYKYTLELENYHDAMHAIGFDYGYRDETHCDAQGNGDIYFECGGYINSYSEAALIKVIRETFPLHDNHQ